MIGRLTGPETGVKLVRFLSGSEDAWHVHARALLRKIKSEPKYLWMWEFGEESLKSARLALAASGYEKAWYGAKHAQAVFYWKGASDDDPQVQAAEEIVQEAEAVIHPTRLDDLRDELAIHLELYDVRRRLDRSLSLLDDGERRSIVAHIDRMVGRIDLHGRWP